MTINEDIARYHKSGLAATERARVEHDPHESERSLRALLNAIQESAFLLDREGTILHANETFAARFGRTPDEMIGTDAYAFLPPELAARRHAYVDEVLRTGRPVRFEDVRNGRYIDQTIYPVLDDNGQVCSLAIFGRDLTEQRQAEEALRQSEERYRSMIETAEEGIWLLDEDNRTTFVNRKMAEMLGYTSEEMLGRPPFDFMDGESQQIALANLERRQRGVAEPQDFKLRRKDGSEIWVLLKASPLFDNEGRYISTLAMFTDITPRKRIEQELAQSLTAVRENERRLQTFFDTMDDLVLVFDVDGHILHHNPVVEQRLGYTADEIRSTHILNLFPPEMRQEAVETVVALITGTTTLCTIPLLAKDTTHIPVQTRVTRGSWENQEVLFAISRDITDLKRTEEALQEANQQLKRSVDELTRRNRDITLLNQMGEQFHSCPSLEEAYTVVENYMPRFFPNQVGMLYQRTAEGYMKVVARWNSSLSPAPNTIRRGCSLIEHGQCVLVETPEDKKLRCQCLEALTAPPEALPYVCVPLIAHGETIGILHLRNGPSPASPAHDLWKHLALTTASKLALELSNLELRDRLRHQSIRDPLTGLFNRRYLDETLKRELEQARRDYLTVGMIMFDIDHFKLFNDAHGHDGGDTLLRAVGALLQRHTRRGDIACRYGGEEFTLILPGASLSQTRRRAEFFRSTIEQLRVTHANLPLGPVTASFGVAAFPNHAATDETLIKAADIALYQAKTNGRNQVVVAASQLGAASYGETIRP